MPDYNAIPNKIDNDPITQQQWDDLAADIQLHQDVATVRPANNTGGTVTRGYVGVLDDAAANSLIATAVAGDQRRVAVVQDASVVVTGLVYCQMQGRCSAVNVTGAVGLHQPLEVSGTPGFARQGSSAPFAVALEAWAGPGTATIQALLIPMMAGAGFPVGDPSATHGPWPFHLTTATVNHLVVAPGPGLSIYITKIRIQQNNTTPSLLTANDTAGPTRVESYPMAGVQGHGVIDEFDPPWKIGANEGFDIQQSATGDLYGSANGYVAAG